MEKTDTPSAPVHRRCSSSRFSKGSDPITSEWLLACFPDSWQNGTRIVVTGMFWWSISHGEFQDAEKPPRMYVPNDARSWRQPKSRNELIRLLELTTPDETS